jgi:disulfide bond formation protein DsbB
VVESCASPAGTRKVCVAGSLNWSIFSSSLMSIYVSKVRHSFIWGNPSGLPTMSAAEQTDQHLGRHSHTDLSWQSTTQCSSRS